MIKEIRFSEEFDRAFKRLKKRYRSLPDDVKKLLASLIENPRQGAELYNANSSPSLKNIRRDIRKDGLGESYIYPSLSHVRRRTTTYK